MNPVHIHPVRK